MSFKGRAVWVPSDDERDGFAPGVVTNMHRKLASVRTPSGDLCLPNDQLLSREVCPGEEFRHPPNDLGKLVHFNDAEALQAVRIKHLNDSGTDNTFSIGPVTVSLTPSADRAQETDQGLVDVANRAVEAAVESETEQFIIVHGLAGSGKAVAAGKICQALMGKTISIFSDGEIGNMLWNTLSSAFKLLSQFGNAYTAEQDSSQRFMKQVTIRYNDQGEAAGVQIKASVLEKTRVVTRPLNERNFHIFYQLCEGMTEEERVVMGMRSRQRIDFLSAGHDMLPKDKFDDAAAFEETRALMKQFNMEQSDQQEIFNVLAAIMHLGNISFFTDRDTDEVVMLNPTDMDIIASLLGVDPEELLYSLTHRIFLTKDGSPLPSPLMLNQVLQARDELSTMLYANIFDQMLAIINQTLGDLHFQSDEDQADYCRVTVIDPPGFESLHPLYVTPRSNKDIKRRLRRRRRGKSGAGAFSPAERAWKRAATTFQASFKIRNAFALLGDQYQKIKDYNENLEIFNEQSPFSKTIKHPSKRSFKGSKSRSPSPNKTRTALPPSSRSSLLSEAEMAMMPAASPRLGPAPAGGQLALANGQRDRSPSRSFVSPANSPSTLAGRSGRVMSTMSSVGFDLGPAPEPGSRRQSYHQGRDRTMSMASLDTTTTMDTVMTTNTAGEMVPRVKKKDLEGDAGEILCPNQTGFNQFVFNYVNDRLLHYMYTTITREEWAGALEDYMEDPDYNTMPACKATAMFEDERSGVIAALEEESYSTRGTDSRFASKVLREYHETKADRCSTAFQVEHGFGTIRYETTNFVTANRRPVRIELFEIMKKHMKSFKNPYGIDPNNLTVGFHRDDAVEEQDAEGKRVGRMAALKAEMDVLCARMTKSTMRSGHNHMVVCVRGGKGHDDAGDDFVGTYVVEQLKAAGLPLVEQIRGKLSIRMDAVKFNAMYYCVLQRGGNGPPMDRDVANKLVLDEYSTSPEQYMQNGDAVLMDKHVFKVIERTREQLIMKQSTQRFQELMHGHLARCLFKKISEESNPGFGAPMPPNPPFLLTESTMEECQHLIKDTGLHSYAMSPWAQFEKSLFEPEVNKEAMLAAGMDSDDEEPPEADVPALAECLWNAVNKDGWVQVAELKSKFAKFWSWLEDMDDFCEQVLEKAVPVGDAHGLLQERDLALDKDNFIECIVEIVAFRMEGKRVAGVFLQMEKNDEGKIEDKTLKQHFAAHINELEIKGWGDQLAFSAADSILHHLLDDAYDHADAVDCRGLLNLVVQVKDILRQKSKLKEYLEACGGTIEGMMRRWETVGKICGLGGDSQRAIAVLFGALVAKYGSEQIGDEAMLDLVLRAKDLTRWTKALRKVFNSLKNDDERCQLARVKDAYGTLCASLDLDAHTVSAMGAALDTLPNHRISWEDLQDATCGVWRNSEICKKVRSMVTHLLPAGEKYAEAAAICSKLRAVGDNTAARRIEDEVCEDDERMKRLHRAFISCDFNQSGEVSFEELKERFQMQATIVQLPPSDISKVMRIFNPQQQGRYLRHKANEGARLFAAMDADGSGEMSFLEFLSLVDGCVQEPTPTLEAALKTTEGEKYLANFSVDRIGGIDVRKMWNELHTLKPTPLLTFEDASAALIKVAERSDFRAEVGSLFGELFGTDDAVATVDEIWKHVPAIMMRLRRGKTSMGRAYRLLVAYGRKDQLLDKRTFVAYMDRLRPYHRRRENLRNLYDFLDYESATNTEPDAIRAVGKKDGILALKDVQIHIAAVARELEFVDVTEQEKEWLFDKMGREYGGEVNWDCFNILVINWSDFRDTTDCLRGIFQALDTSEFGVNQEFPRVPLEDVFEALADIMLELGLPEPDDETLATLSEFVMLEEQTHTATTWGSHLVQADDELIEAETFQQAFIKWKTQILYASKISEAWEMLDQKGGREDADHLVSVQDVIESFELVGEIFSIVIRPGMAHDFLRGFPYLDENDEIPRDEFEYLAKTWLSSHTFKRRADPLVVWRLFEDFTTESRELEPQEEIMRVAFGPQGRALGLGECGVDEVFLLCELMEENRESMMSDDGRASLDEFVMVLDMWKEARFKPRDLCKYDNAI